MTNMMTVEKVDGPNDNGWYEIIFNDGVKASTKNEELAKAAFQSRGSEVAVEMTERVSGKFTNVYLNEIDGLKDSAKPKRGAGASKATSAPRGKSPEEQDRIARQWAYGRAVELLIAAGAGDFTFPLDDETKAQMTETAEWLISVTK